MNSRKEPEKKRWQEQYRQKHGGLFKRPNLVHDFYSKREEAWVFISEQIERIIGYALNRYNLNAEARETLHANSMSDVLIAMYKTKYDSADDFEREALRQCANSVSRTYYSQQQDWKLEQRTEPYEEAEEQLVESARDLALYHLIFDAAYQLQKSDQLRDKRVCRLLTENDFEKLEVQKLKILILYLLVVLLKLSKTSELEIRALIGAYLLGDNDEVTSRKIFVRTKQKVAPINIRKARSKGLKKLKMLIEGVIDDN